MARSLSQKLTDKQLKFIEEYLIDLNGEQACLRAGYSKKSARGTASTLLANPNIFREITARQAKRQERTEITADYVISGIVDTIERCKQAKPVTDRKGNPVLTETADGSMAPAYKFDSASVLKGYELLGKHLGLFTDKLELKGKMEIDSLSALIDEIGADSSPADSQQATNGGLDDMDLDGDDDDS